jgi:hypothetical protein
VHGVAPDTLARILQRRRLGEQTDGSLGGGVLRAAVVHADQAELRGDVHDRATAGATHGRDRRADSEKHPLGVHLHHAIPRLGRRILDAAGGPYAGVVDEHVEPAEALNGQRDRVLPVGLPADVEPSEDRLAALGDDLGLDRVALHVEHVAEDNARALTGEQTRLGGAHAARRSADQRDLPGQPHATARPPGAAPATPRAA